VLRTLILKLKLPIKKLLFRHWIDEANKVEAIILFDISNALAILLYLRKKFPNKRIILWYWNSVARTICPDKIKKNGFEIWSFDNVDCKTYGFSRNTQFYFEGNLNRAFELSDFHEEVLFVGANKDRAEYLDQIAELFLKYGITFNFRVVGVSEYTPKNFTYSEGITYPKLLGMIKNTKVVLDIVSMGQLGLTLRPIEALFFKKKLITNSISIKNEPIYNPNNVFILGYDDETKLRGFIDLPYDDSKNKELEDYYSEKGWLKRFI
jgi:hypothetical protein